MRAQRGVDGMGRVVRLYPHLRMAALGGHVVCVAPCAAGRLHQQAEQAFGRAVVAGKQRAVGLHCGHQGDAPEVMALGHHLGADQHVNVAGMHLGQLLLQRALGARGVGVYARHAGGLAVGALHVAQQAGQFFLQLLRALAQRQDVGIAAAGAGHGHALGVAAVVAAQRAVGLVEDLVGTAVRAVAFPAAVGAEQHGREAAAVEQHQALLAALHTLGDGIDQRRREHGLARLLAHVHQAHARQGGRADAAGHVQAQVAAALRLVGIGRAAGVPALQRGRGAAQDDLGAGIAPAPDGQVARRVARAFLLLVAGVVLLVHHDQRQPRQAGEHRHARAQHDARRARVCRQPALEPLRVGHAAVHADHAGRAILRRKARQEALLQLGREIDLGHHHQHLGAGVGIQRGLGGPQVDLGLAAARAAVEQEGAGVGGDLREDVGLLGAEDDGGNVCGGRGRCER